MKTVEVPLSQGLVAIIDAEDAPVIAPFKWCASASSWGTYALTNIVKPDGQRSMLKMHRLLLKAGPDQLVDHKNRNGLDNRRLNLRLCDTVQNGANAGLSKANSSGYRGVTWSKQKRKWQGLISPSGKARHLGFFDDPWEAAQAYNEAARELWGEFAYQNEVRVS